jgi:hypothetical protein
MSVADVLSTALNRFVQMQYRGAFEPRSGCLQGHVTCEPAVTGFPFGE